MTNFAVKEERIPVQSNIISGGGVTEQNLKDLHIATEKLENRLQSMRVPYTGEVSIKDHETEHPKVTLELWVKKYPKLVATASDKNLKKAYIEVSEKMIKQVQSLRDKKKDHHKHHNVENTIPEKISVDEIKEELQQK